MRKEVLLIAVILCLSLSSAIVIILLVQQRHAGRLLRSLQEQIADQEGQLESLGERIRSLTEVTAALPRYPAGTNAIPRQEAARDRNHLLDEFGSDPRAGSEERIDVSLAGSVERVQERQSSPEVSLADPTPQTALDLQVQQELDAGLRLYEAGQYKEATARFSAILDHDPDNSQAHYYYAASLYLANPGASVRYGEIEQHLLRVVNCEPENSAALQLLGMLYTEQQRWQQALGRFRQVIALQPQNAACLRTAGLCALYSNDHESAERYFLNAVGERPDEAELWYYLGLARAKAGKLEEGLAAYNMCLELEPRHPMAGLQAGLALRDLGRFSEGQRQLAVQLKTNSGSEVLAAMGDCCYGGGALLEAESYWSRSLDQAGRGTPEEKRKAAELFSKLARSARRREDQARSLSFAEQGLACEPLPILQAYQGLGYLVTGKIMQGRTILRSIVQNHPGTEAASLAAEALP